MKRVLFICGFLLTVAILWGQGHEQEGSDSVLLKPYAIHNEKIQNGEFLFRVKELHKKNAPEKEYLVYFQKIEPIGKTPKVIPEFQYNILSLQDSMRYVFNHKHWYVINHKKGTYEEESDSSWCEIGCSFPYLWPDVLLNQMLCWYVRNYSLCTHNEEKALKEGDFVSLHVNVSSGPTNKLIRFRQRYTWNLKTYLLISCRQYSFKTDKHGKERMVTGTENTLVKATLNQHEYENSMLYDGANFIRENYKKRKGISN